MSGERNIPQRTLVEVEATFGRMLAFEDDLITSQIREFGNHTRPEIAFLLSVVAPGDAIFDIGAHIGTFTIPLANKAGATGRVLAVEGTPETCEVLQANLERLRPGAELSILNAVVGSEQQPMTARHQPDNSGASYFLPAAPGAAPDAPTVSLDELCRRYFVPRVLKIDIEGMEFAALHASSLLASARPILYVEIAHQQLARTSTTVEDFDRLLRERGYRMFRNAGDRNAAHDRFVVAELTSLPNVNVLYDILVIHGNDERLNWLRALAAGELPAQQGSPSVRALRPLS